MGEMTQEQLEAASGVSQTQISRLLKGGDPRLSTLLKLERALPNLATLRSKSVAA